eukprot:2204453-Ditylum_brightwellii.AAC.1
MDVGPDGKQGISLLIYDTNDIIGLEEDIDDLNSFNGALFCSISKENIWAKFLIGREEHNKFFV